MSKNVSEGIVESLGEREQASLRNAPKERVIQCPSCRAIFCVQEGLLHGSDAGGRDSGSDNQHPSLRELRLHCSCCDALFALSENPYFGTPSEYHRPVESKDDLIEEEEVVEDEAESSELEPSDEVLEDSSEPTPPPVGLRPIQENLFALFQSKTVLSQLDRPPQSDGPQQLDSVAREEPRYIEEEVEEEDELEDNEEVDPELTQEIMSEEFDFYILDKEDLDKEEQRKESAQVIDIVPPDPSMVDTVEASQILYRPTPPPRASTVGSSTTLFFMLGPLVGFLFLLYGFGEYLQKDGAAQSSVRSLLNYSQPSPPPKEILMHDLKLQRRQFADGAEYFVVQGMLVSDYDKAVQEVDAEVVLFNAQGVPVASKVVRIGRPVEVDDAIESVQNLLEREKSASSLENRIEPGVKRPVRIFFAVEDVKKAEFFAARILSVW